MSDSVEYINSVSTLSKKKNKYERKNISTLPNKHKQNTQQEKNEEKKKIPGNPPKSGNLTWNGGRLTNNYKILTLHKPELIIVSTGNYHKRS